MKAKTKHSVDDSILVAHWDKSFVVKVRKSHDTHSKNRKPAEDNVMAFSYIWQSNPVTATVQWTFSVCAKMCQKTKKTQASPFAENHRHFLTLSLGQCMFRHTSTLTGYLHASNKFSLKQLNDKFYANHTLIHNEKDSKLNTRNTSGTRTNTPLKALHGSVLIIMTLQAVV